MNRQRTREIATGTISAGVLAALALGSMGCQSMKYKLTNQEPPRLLSSRNVVPPPYLAPAPKPEAKEVAPAPAPVKAPVPQPAAPQPVVTAPRPVAPRPVQAVEPDPILSLDVIDLDDPVIAAPAPVVEKRPVVEIAAAPPLPEPPDPQLLTHDVQKGESLWEIGRMYGVSFQELAAFNNLDVKDILKVGKTLRIPPGGRFIPADERPVVKQAAPAAKTKEPAIAREAIPADGQYKVRKGDSLWVIGRRFGLTVGDLRKFNGLSGDMIRPGQTLALKDGMAPRSAAAPRTAAASPAPAHNTEPVPNKYIVQPNDSLWKIARRFGISMEQIMKLNNLQKTDMLHPGQALVLTSADGLGVEPTQALPVAMTTAMDNTARDAFRDAAAADAAAPAVADNTGLPREDVMQLQRLPHFVEPTDTLESIATMYNSKVEWMLIVNPNVKSDKDLTTVKTIQVPVELLD